MKEEKNITFIKGTLLGIGLGLLLAPEEGSEIRKELKKSFSKLIDSVKQIDIEENKKILMAKLKLQKKQKQ